jgi:soluble lytic murein transglycosylase
MAAAAARLRPADRAWCWSQIAAGAQRKMLPEATAWAREARTARASDETLATLARASLRATDWAGVRSAIERMSDAARSEPVWTYWLGRALQAQSDSPDGRQQARALFTLIAGHPDFYSQLAAEELGTRFAVPTRAAPPTATEAPSTQILSVPALLHPKMACDPNVIGDDAVMDFTAAALS